MRDLRGVLAEWREGGDHLSDDLLKLSVPEEWSLELEMQAEEAGMTPGEYAAQLISEALDKFDDQPVVGKVIH